MRKFFIMLVACSCLVAACQKDVQTPVDENLQEVTFDVTIPEVVYTKATTLGAGERVTQLYYAVYMGTSNEEGYAIERVEPVDAPTQPLTLTDKKASLTLKLVKNCKYDIVFWAQTPDAPYRFDKDKATLTVTDAYSGALALANDENRDAFYAMVDDYVVTSDFKSVPMFRPFAQINFCSNDFERVTELNLPMTSTIEVTKAEVPSVMNLLTGATESPVPIRFTHSDVPAYSGETVDITIDGVSTSCSNLSMNYVLAGKSSANITNLIATFNYNDDKVVVNVPNVPYQGNWRTNILVSLLSNLAVFDIELKPSFLDDHNDNY